MLPDLLPHLLMREDIPQGTLDMLILRTLARNAVPLHGFEIAESIASVSSRVFIVEEGSLYPALQRMLVQGWIVGEWGRTADNRRARYYRVTASGRRQLDRALRSYARVSTAIAAILDLSPSGA
jgi:transcriptional regulator